ncbi:MAG: hypothetical protein R3Y53_03050 [Bacillota bacterium]
MNQCKSLLKKLCYILVIPILVGCGGQKVSGIANACPLPGTYTTTVLKAQEEGYKDVLVLGSSKFYVEEKIDVGTKWVIGISHTGEVCTNGDDFLHFFQLEKAVYDEGAFQTTIDANIVITVKSLAEVEAEIAAAEAAAAEAAAAKAAQSSSGSTQKILEIPENAVEPPAPVPVLPGT